MTTTNSTKGEAVGEARALWQSGATPYARLCLKHVREDWDIPLKYPTARDAWQGAKKRHAWTGDTEDIPYGATVFSRRKDAPASDSGHVFLCGGHDRTGKRIFWTNDAVVLGGISPVHIDFFVEKWGHEILGWTEDLNGVDLNLGMTPNERKKKKKAAKKATKKSPAKKKASS